MKQLDGVTTVVFVAVALKFGGIHPTVEEDGVEGVDWKWVNEEKTTWASIDEKGRYYPCCEFEYDTEEDNFDWDED